MKIDNLDTAEKVFIVAEIGNNHEGDAILAHKMIEEAARCGVDAVKFQTFTTELFVSPSNEARFRRLKSFELTQDEFRGLAQAAKQNGLVFFSTPLDLESALFLEPLVSVFKVASGDNDFVPLLMELARTSRPIILSSGISELGSLRRSVELIENFRAERGILADLAILHCVSSYPTPDADANLLAIRSLQEAFPKQTIGYSDHTIGIEASIAAVALGARILEKHFTIDKNYSDFRDHSLSADPDEMSELVEWVRRLERMLGDGRKVIQESERDGTEAYRRSIVAGTDLPSGHQVSVSDLTWMRPGGGIAPGGETALLGKILTRAVKRGERILLADVEA